MFNIETRRSSKKNIEAIIITQNDKVLRFNGSGRIHLEKVSRDTSKEELVEANLFDCLNDYVDATFDSDKKTELFKLYEKAHHIVESGLQKDYHLEVAEVTPIIDDILLLIGVDKYCAYVGYSQYMQIPADLTLATAKGDYPEQTTITDVDYVWIVHLLFVVRVAYPIIFPLLMRYTGTMGKGHAELACGELICNNLSITNLPGYQKLKTYVNFTFDKRGTTAQVDSVSSTENFKEKVLFSTIFNRLCTSVVPETEEGKNIATAINSSVRHHETSGPRLIPKDFGNNEDEDKRSLYERNQATEQVKSADEAANAEYFTFGLLDEKEQERHKDRFKYQCLGLGIKNVELVEAVYDRLPPNWNFELTDHVLLLLQLVYQDDIPALNFWAFDYRQLMAAIALGQVKLAERGFKYLPSILGAIHDPEGFRSLSEGLKLNSDDKDFLTSICDIQSLNNDGRSFNEAVLNATNFLSKLGNGIWQSNLEYAVLDEPAVYKRVNKATLFSLELDVEIKNEFMTLIRQNNA